MLFFLKFFPEKNNAEKEQINTAGYRSILLNIFPCCFHFSAPVYIIENKDRIVMGFKEQFLEIVFSWFLPVVTVNKSEIDGRQATDN